MNGESNSDSCAATAGCLFNSNDNTCFSGVCADMNGESNSDSCVATAGCLFNSNDNTCFAGVCADLNGGGDFWNSNDVACEAAGCLYKYDGHTCVEVAKTDSGPMGAAPQLLLTT